MTFLDATQEWVKTGDNCPFRIVGGAAELAALQQKPPAATPAVYFFTADEAHEKNSRATGPSLQDTSYQVNAVIITRNLTGKAGEAAYANVEVLKEWVKRRLMGWVPTDMEDPIENGGGQVVDFKAGTIWWEHVFFTGRNEVSEQ